MNILKKLTIKDLKLNKKRTIGTLIGIILSTALITAVGAMGFVFQNTLLQFYINQDGYYHIQFLNINEEKLATIKNNKNFSHIETVYDLGHAINLIGEDDYQYSHLYSMNEETANYLKYTITEGRFPKNNSEVILNSYYAERLNLKIGDKVKFTSGDMSDEQGNSTNEITYDTYITNSKNYEFTVVGITSKSPAIITTDIKSEKIAVYLTLQNPKNYKNDLNELLGTEDYTKENSKIYAEYLINKDILHWEVFSFSENTFRELLMLVAIIIFIILIASVFSIRNSFAISTTEKTKTYGMLSSIRNNKKTNKKYGII